MIKHKKKCRNTVFLYQFNDTVLSATLVGLPETGNIHALYGLTQPY